MRLIYTALIAAFLHALFGATFIWQKEFSFNDFFGYFVMGIGYALIIAFVCVCIYRLLLFLNSSLGFKLGVIAQIAELLIGLTIGIVLLFLPDLLRSFNGSIPKYTSFGDFFRKWLVEPLSIATIYALLIPIIYNILTHILEKKIEHKPE